MLAAHISLNNNHTPPVSGALGVIGVSGRAGSKEVNFDLIRHEPRNAKLKLQNYVQESFIIEI